MEKTLGALDAKLNIRPSISLDWILCPRYPYSVLMNLDVAELSSRPLMSLNWWQFQCDCFIISNVIGEDPWYLRCTIEYMSLDVAKFNICSSISLKLMVWMQFQCDCFIISNVSGEDPWYLRCKIEYMSLDVPKLDFMPSMSLYWVYVPRCP